MHNLLIQVKCIQKQKELQSKINANNLINYIAVSYTHLDVYKRQPAIKLDIIKFILKCVYNIFILRLSSVINF